jgi:thermitase
VPLRACLKVNGVEGYATLHPKSRSKGIMFALSTLIVTGAVILLAWAMEGKTRRPVLALPALLGLAIGLGSRLFSGGSLMTVTGGLFLDSGVGLLVAGGYLVLRDADPRRFLVPGAMSLVLGLATMAPSMLWNLVEPNTEFDHFLVELGPDDSIDELSPVLSEFGATAERAFPRLTLAEDEDLAQYYIVHAETGLDELRRRLDSDVENVDATEWDIAVAAVPVIESKRPTAVPFRRLANDPQAAEQWGLAITKADQLHDNLRSRQPDKKAIVAIVDTGIDQKHEDIAGPFDKSPGTGDRNGHGTHCAGIAGASTNNGVGIASFNWDSKFVSIRGYKALGDNGGGSAETVSQAIIDAARDGADVISLSLGSFSPNAPRVEVQAIEYALKQGAIVVAASGNANSDAKQHSPANIAGVIAVSAVDQNNRKASFSNTNSSLNRPIAAPGVGILSLKPGNGYVSLNGTSMAAPFVAGLLGVMRALHPELSAEDAYKILRQTGQEGPDAKIVGTTIDAASAVETLLNVRRAAAEAS